MDGAHPLHNSQPAYGLIKKNTDMVLKSNTKRERLNINNAYDIEHSPEIIHESVSINGQATIELFNEIKQEQINGKIYMNSTRAY